MAQLERSRKSCENTPKSIFSPQVQLERSRRRSCENTPTRTSMFSPLGAHAETSTRSFESPKSPKSQTSPTFEQLLKVEEAYWSSSTSPACGKIHDQDECLSPSSNKKSVLAKVKERAKKFRHSLSGKKKQIIEPGDEHRAPPWCRAGASPVHEAGGNPWCVTLDEDYDDQPDEDPEYLGAPMYESEAAPDSLKETARQHPRAVPVVSEKHRAPKRILHEDVPGNDKAVSPNTSMSQAVTEISTPAYAAVSDATHQIASKLPDVNIEAPERKAHETGTRQGAEAKKMSENAGNQKQCASSSPQTWDKGVSVKEYFLNKLEPGDDERALSQAITDAISPRKMTGDNSVVEKVKEAVTSFLWQEDLLSNTIAKVSSLSPAAPAPAPASAPASLDIQSSTQQNRTPLTNSRSSKILYYTSENSSPRIPLSTNAHEVQEEENHGKILQAN